MAAALAAAAVRLLRWDALTRQRAAEQTDGPRCHQQLNPLIPNASSIHNRRKTMTSTGTTTPSRPLTDDARPRWRAVLAIAIAVAVAAVPAALGDTVVSLIARQIGGVSGKFTPMQPAAYIPLTIIGLIAGALGWYTITRVSARPGRILRWLVPAAIVLSFIPDIAVGISRTLPYTTWAGVAALMVMHVVVAGAGVTSYCCFLPSQR
jgi:hypothetical protein